MFRKLLCSGRENLCFFILVQRNKQQHTSHLQSTKGRFHLFVSGGNFNPSLSLRQLNEWSSSGAGVTRVSDSSWRSNRTQHESFVSINPRVRIRSSLAFTTCLSEAVFLESKDWSFAQFIAKGHLLLSALSHSHLFFISPSGWFSGWSSRQLSLFEPLGNNNRARMRS